MSNERRVLLFMLATFASIMTINFVMEATGLLPPPPPPERPPAAVAEVDPGEKDEAGPAVPPDVAGEPKAAAETPRNDAAEVAKKAPEIKPSNVPLLEPAELVLGSAKPSGPDGFQLEVQLDQRGAGVVSVASARFDAEYDGIKPVKAPLEIIRRDNFAPLSLSMTLKDLAAARAAAALEDEDEVEVEGPVIGIPSASKAGEIPLDSVVWEVVRDDQGRAVRPTEKGEELVFRTTLDDLGLTITKTYTLEKGSEAFAVALTFEAPEKTANVSYRLLGPHGVPIEGEWYTATFRDAIFGQLDGGETKVATLSAYDIAKYRGDSSQRFATHPIKYVGVENQYFAALLLPWPPPADESKRWEAEASPILLHEDVADRQKSDIGVEVLSKPLTVGPNVPATHTYKVYAGAKTAEALAPFGAEDVATYRKSSWIPFATLLGKSLITPLLAMTYGLTKSVASLFGGTRGNYGVAIILMTVIVRLGMFPLSRKQAISAKKMQDLQPYMKEVQEKYKDDKEAQTRETFALYKRHGVNPIGGCLPALIQLPIFVGLWQALNNSVSLRHASFLYIENLAAPDMLFAFPNGWTLPFLGQYFNLLPFVVVALMLVQTKLFAPPPTTPEAEMQQKMMKYMMVFMAFMFYKVPSGLGLYFITSSLWSICERLLLPKTLSSTVVKGNLGDDASGGDGGGGKGGGPVVPKPPGRLAKFWDKVVAEAAKDPTYRKLAEEKSRGREGDGRDREARERDKTKPRARPGRRR